MLNDIYQSLDPVAFSVGPLVVRWYGLAYLAGFALAAFVIYRVCRHWRIEMSGDDLLTLILCCAFGVIIGARLGYCLFYGNGYYLAHPLEIFALSNGGMSFHGGLIGIVVGAVIASRMLHMPLLTITDLGAIAAPVGLFFGRCANFINGELWGAPTDLPWGVVFAATGGGNVPRHPSQLYEALLEGAVLFIILFALSRKNDPPRPRGTFFGTFLVFYGVFRISVEFIRQPDAQIGYLFGTSWITEGMMLSLPMVMAGIILLVICRRLGLSQEGRRESRGVA